jgi:bifunctional non-homologous end joining protein LigD
VALADLPVTEAIIDGEVVAENAAGVPDFSALQDALSTGRTDRLVFYAFDVLYLDGYDLRLAPLVARKSALEAIIITLSAVRYSEHFEDNGPRLLSHVCRLGLEGVVSKIRNAPYRSGRVKSWIKSKCSNRQEFVIAGFVASTVSSKAIGSLVLGYFDGGKLVHAGRVGTGFSHKLAEDLFRRLDAMSIPKSPFARKLSTEGGPFRPRLSKRSPAQSKPRSCHRSVPVPSRSAHAYMTRKLADGDPKARTTLAPATPPLIKQPPRAPAPPAAPRIGPPTAAGRNIPPGLHRRVARSGMLLPPASQCHPRPRAG